MAQMTIYLPDDLEKRARKAAKAEGSSVSRWIAAQLEEQLDDRLPQAVLDAAGAAPDFPELSQVRIGYSEESKRERI